MSGLHENRGVAAIDGFLSEWDVRDFHETVLDVPPEQALGAVLAAPAAPGFVRVLLRLRGLKSRGSIEAFFLDTGFELLAREATEIVVGGTGKPWLPRAAISSFEDVLPGSVRIVANFLAVPLPDGSTRLSTETRVAAVDGDARRAFRRYWRVVGPFSALIRRRWLAAARRSVAHA